MIQQKRENNQKTSIKVLQRKTYGCLAKVFCCKCIHCCQDIDISLLTSNNRKQVFQKMIKRYINKLHKHQDKSLVMDPFFILVALLLGQQSQTYGQLMSIITNQSQPTIFSKQDLQFYIPELCTYLVFHQELKNMELEKLLIRACKVDIHFSLKYYFYMKSLEIIKSQDEVAKYQGVSKYNCQFRSMINHYYQAHQNKRQFAKAIFPQKKCEESILIEKNNSEGEEEHQDQEDKENIRSTFGGLHQSSVIIKKKDQMKSDQHFRTMNQFSQEGSQGKDKLELQQKLKRSKLKFLQQTNIYEPFISTPIKFPKGLFQSTVNFFSDLVQLGNLLIYSQNRKEQMKTYLQKVNKRLPATIYIPFTNQCYQDMNIISIVFNESRVFSTKERAPYYICLESFYNPTYNEGISRDKKIRSASRLKKEQLKKTHLFEDQSSQKKQDWLRESQITIKLQNKGSSEVQQKDIRSSDKSTKMSMLKRSWSNFFNLEQIKNKILNKKDEKEEQVEYQEQQWSQSQKKSQRTTQQINAQLVNNGKKMQEHSIQQLFGESCHKQFQRISETSQYSDLPGYKLIHVIIKSNDDLRQECFAMQLLQQFDKIFKMEDLPVKLSPYQVLPLSHQAGIIQCIKDAITIDEMRKKGVNLSSILNTKNRKKNFLNSLVGYSLITYFLQVKDRHNGNIMIKSDGSLLHIDYGFFMTNMPGKGVELQKNLPFKLTNEYVDALDGLDSKTFQDFRFLFYKAFNACRKHQHRIIILTKLMYSSYGRTMPCFIKGNQSIQKLQQRFNPSGISNDAQISVYCQNLINSSIDNWRSRWYDKWQYYMQGIFY